MPGFLLLIRAIFTSIKVSYSAATSRPDITTTPDIFTP